MTHRLLPLTLGSLFVGSVILSGAIPDPVRLDTDIRNVSGATLSCRHVTDGIRRLLLLHERALSSG